MNIRNLYTLKTIGVRYLSFDFTPKVISRQFNEKCMLCSLYKTRTNIVKDDFKNQKIMMIKFMPNLKENISAKPNKEEVLSVIDIEDIYVTYILKCYGNANQIHINTCLPYLLEEIKLLKPRLIIAFGEDVFYALGLKNFKILRGVLINFCGFKLISSYNQDFITKNPNLKSLFKKDIDTINSYIKGIK